MPIARKATPFWETTDHEKVRLYNGDVLETLRRLPSGSVQCCITSPPYWGLRDYGTGTWEGGDPNCDHKPDLEAKDERRKERQKVRNDKEGVYALGSAWTGRDDSGSASKICKCGAKRTDHQLGSEKSPDCRQRIEVEPGLFREGNCAEENWEEGCHVCRMVLVFREVRRVLRDDGTLWLNYGDTYSSFGGGGVSSIGGFNPTTGKQSMGGLRSGNLVGVPWRVALALQADGWILRQDIIWAKPSPMPESVKNRCTKAHEYVFLFAKKGGYFCDMEAVKEKATNEGETRLFNTAKKAGRLTNGRTASGNEHPDAEPVEISGRNKRSVWLVSSESYPGAHFATFPSKLITPMIKAGTSEKGCCRECGAPWKRVIEENKLTRERPNEYVKRVPVPGVYRLKPEHKVNNTPGVQPQGGMNTCPNSVAGVETRTVGWEPGCSCEAEVVPCVVADIFCGSGTTNAVCITLGRNSIGIELSKDYLVKNAITRIEGELLSRPALSYLVPRAARKSTMVGEDITDE